MLHTGKKYQNLRKQVLTKAMQRLTLALPGLATNNKSNINYLCTCRLKSYNRFHLLNPFFLGSRNP